MLKKHLLVGVTKGALTEEQANKKFEDWINENGNWFCPICKEPLKADDDLKEGLDDQAAKVNENENMIGLPDPTQIIDETNLENKPDESI